MRFTVRRLGRREAVRKVRGTLDPRAKLGSVAETIVNVRRPDAFLVTNRAVDSTLLSTRTRRTRRGAFGATASTRMLCVYPALSG
jgi:hypothetical protein